MIGWHSQPHAMEILGDCILTLTVFLLAEHLSRAWIKNIHLCWWGQQWWMGLGSVGYPRSGWVWRRLQPARWVGHRRWVWTSRVQSSKIAVGGAYRPGMQWHPRHEEWQPGTWQLQVSEPLGRTSSTAQSERAAQSCSRCLNSSQARAAPGAVRRRRSQSHERRPDALPGLV